jgi:serine/threonine-protein kinase
MMFGGAMQVAPPMELAPSARAAALKALELDETLAEPHISLARVLFWYDRDPVGAERELRRAIQLNPNSALAHFIIGLQFGDLRRDDEAMAELQRTMQLDPVSCWFAAHAGFYMYNLGQEEAGWQQLQKALDLDPELFQLRSLRSVLLTYEGKHSEAIAEAQEGARLSSGLPITRGYVGYALGMAGRRGEARAILDELEDLSRQRYVPASSRVLCWLGLGEHERALEWLEKGYERRDCYLPHLRMNRVFRPLDPDPRFQDLLQRLGLLP